VCQECKGSYQGSQEMHEEKGAITDGVKENILKVDEEKAQK
jgi:hypothetical protein